MRIISYLIILLIIIFGVTFATLNSSQVTVNYYVAQSSLPLSLLLALVFSGGCLVGILVCLWLLLKAKMKNRRLRQRLSLAEKEIANLRAIPLQDNV